MSVQLTARDIDDLNRIRSGSLGLGPGVESILNRHLADQTARRLEVVEANVATIQERALRRAIEVIEAEGRVSTCTAPGHHHADQLRVERLLKELPL